MSAPTEIKKAYEPLATTRLAEVKKPQTSGGVSNNNNNIYIYDFHLEVRRIYSIGTTIDKRNIDDKCAKTTQNMHRFNCYKTVLSWFDASRTCRTNVDYRWGFCYSKDRQANKQMQVRNIK